MTLNINEEDCRARLAREKKPVAVYGMGDAAERITAELADIGVEVIEYFASDDFVRGQSFLGKRVLTYGEACERLGDFNCVLAFATHIDGVIENIERISRERTLLAPDMPVAGGGIFTGKYFEENRARFEAVYERLADDESRRVYESVIRFKISGDIKHLMSCFTRGKSEIYSDILHLSQSEDIVDAGAYDGDTIREFMRFTGGKYSSITALEPDRKNFKKLCRNTAGMKNLTLINAAAWNECGRLSFEQRSGRSSRLSGVGGETEALSIDSVLSGGASFIKMDVEGAEMRALCGCEKTIRQYLPKLYICAYHRNEDMFALPEKIWSLDGDYSVYFRHSVYIPAWESNFYCVNKKQG